MHHYEDVAAMLTARRGQNDGKSGRSLADPYPSTPSGYLRVDVGKSCVLLLTREEYVNGVKRGKAYRRAVARQMRTRKEITR